MAILRASSLLLLIVLASLLLRSDGFVTSPLCLPASSKCFRTMTTTRMTSSMDGSSFSLKKNVDVPPSSTLPYEAPPSSSSSSASSSTASPPSDNEEDDDGKKKEREKLKRGIVKSVLGVNRGFTAKEEEKLEVEELVEVLETLTPNPQPTKGFVTLNSPIAGKWRLIYTSALDVLLIGTNPTVSIGQILQTISKDGRRVVNIIELQPPFASVANTYIGSTVTRLNVLIDSDVESDTALKLTFVRAEVEPVKVFGRDASSKLPKLGVNFPTFIRQSGSFETTYVDENFRVGRSNNGSLFVSVKEDDEDVW